MEEAIKDHDRNLENLLLRCREKNLKLNKLKARIRRTEVPFFGHLLTTEGLKPDPSKVECVKNLKEPTSVKEAQSFVGFCVYLSKFLKQLSTILEPIMKISRSESEFEWKQPQRYAF